MAKMGVWLALLLLVCVVGAVDIPKSLRDQLHNVEMLHMSKIHKKSSGYFSGMQINVHFFNKSFELDLKPNRQIFQHFKEAIVIGEDGKETPFQVDKENYFIGRVVGDPLSSVTLYVSPEGHLHGRILAFGETYVLESAFRHYKLPSFPAQEYTVVYRTQDLINKYDPHSSLNESGHSFCGVDSPASEGYHEELSHEDHDEIMHAARHRRATGPVSAINNFCVLTLVSDSQFYASNGASTATVTSVMISHITLANPTYQVQGWYTATAPTVNVYSNLQVSVQRLLVYTSTGTDPYYSSTGYTGSSGPQTLLSLFSTAPGQTSTGGWGGTCLAHLFTHYSFSGGTLGLAWVGNPASNRAGGICHSSAGTWLNTGWTTNVNGGVTVPTLMDQLVTTHEIGHNWGSPHDTAGAVCLGDNTNGHYVMYPTAVDGSGNNNRMFSPCSVTNITLVLAAKGNCFQPSPAGFCGDYTVTTSTGEQCDAGIDGDSCCHGLSSATPCKWIGTANCSDTSDICCKNCKPSNSSVTCFTSFLNDAQCRANAQCNPSAPHTCPSPTAKAFGSPCGNGGICSGTSATSSACISLCSRFGANTCKCAFPNECHLCCVHNSSLSNTCGSPFSIYGSTCTRASVALANATNASCLIQTYWTSVLGRTIRYNATQKDPACASSNASCWLLLDYVPNTVCSLGVCDSTGTCVQQSTNTAYSWATLGDISLDKVSTWMKENIVGTVLIFSFILWLPIGCLVHRYDKRQRKLNSSYGLRQGGATMTFRPRRTQQPARVPGARPAGPSRPAGPAGPRR